MSLKHIDETPEEAEAAKAAASAFLVASGDAEGGASTGDDEGPLAHALRHADSGVSIDKGSSGSTSDHSASSKRQQPVSFKDKPGTRHEQDDNYVYTVSPVGEITHAHDKKLLHTFALQPLKPLNEQRSAQFSIAGLPTNLRTSKRKANRTPADVAAAKAGAEQALDARNEEGKSKSTTCAIL